MIEALQRIFDFIYVNERVGVPEFRIHHWQDKVLFAIRNPDLEGSEDLLAQEAVYRARREALNANFEKIVGLLSQVPDPLKLAVLYALVPSVRQLGAELGLSTTLVEDLERYSLEQLSMIGPMPDPALMQQAGALLQQSIAAVDETTTQEPAAEDGTQDTTTE